jgi:hypothetical protein
MEIRVVRGQPLPIRELQEMARNTYGNLVKAVVDVEQGIMAVGGEFYAEEEVVLIEQEGSKREYTWGINLYPEKSEEESLEFDSVINLKPSFGNRSRGVESEETREQIKEAVQRLVKK